METGDLSNQLLPLLRQVFGSKVRLLLYEIGNQKQDYWVLLAYLEHPSLTVVLKLAGPQAQISCPFERTAALHRLVAAQTTIPMSEFVAVDTSYQTWPWRYCIKTYVPGEEWAAVR